jgi:DNA-binding GntR family transcriptional regulator
MRSDRSVFAASAGYTVDLVASDRPAFDPASAVPLYEQAADWIAGQVERGELRPGQKLPAERDLADQWGIGYQTVRRAMRELRERGLIVSRVGKGTFVSARPGQP